MPAYDSGSISFGSPVSNDYRIAALQGDFLDGSPQVWLPLELTYSFPSGASYFDGGLNYGEGEVSAGWLPLNSAQQAAVRKALNAWSDVSGITFTEVVDGTTVGDLRFAFTWDITGTVSGWAYTPASGSARAGDVWLKASLASEIFGPSSGSYGSYNVDSAVNYQLLLHEIGHALGLSHPFAKPDETRGTAALPTEEDHFNNTVMSYSPYPHHGGIPSTPMPYDILAIQDLYLSNYSHKTGNDTYGFDINDINLLTIWDAGGVDTIVATNNANITKGNGLGFCFSVIDLREGAGSQIGFLSTTWADPYSNDTPNGFGWRSAWPNIYIAHGAVIENAVGSNGKDLITGNGVGNKITGGFGSDVIDGGAGVDTAVFSGVHGQYTLSKSADGYLLEDTVVNRDGSDTLISIERLQFSDAKIALDIDGNAGKVYRLYEAAFNRAPDKPGLAYWIWHADEGALFTEIASAFSGGIEFQNKYGSLGNNPFVEQLYLNILDRAGESGGLAYWQWQLNDGFQSREQVLYGFSESDENQIGVIGAIENGIDYTT